MHYTKKTFTGYLFKIFQKLNNLLVIYFFITKFIITFAHPFKKAC